ncbi:hypothetical protein [Candidatus Deianiraea vastatrix]|uniref:DUF2335 domain-containing protein n=1 Tax=Candidatus Deianiraea vastatrix TaxID=2163644 RepID=A0A5B8XE90_9RICK|nr:hypothetical protein [Candidatus Deianiraea vastatrix]QED23583.1 hypothetical protein Deia_00795 [Candidatus Deianiraea vastatrix]
MSHSKENTKITKKDNGEIDLTQQKISSGPLPSADEFKKYVEIYPDAKHKIFELASEETKIKKEALKGMIDVRKKDRNHKTFIHFSLLLIFAVLLWHGKLETPSAMILSSFIAILPFIQQLINHYFGKK